MMRILNILVAALLCLGAVSTGEAAQKRIKPKKFNVQGVKIRFNEDYLGGDVLLIDARTDEEKVRDKEAGSLAGSVILFVQGHMQQADDGLCFSTDLAMMSRSGIVVVPVMNTPYGRDKKWRGDRAKDVLLMELAEYALHQKGIRIKGYKKITEKKVVITPVKKTGVDDEMIPAQVSLVGYSHGAIISRRLAWLYSESIINMGQVTPAGYEKWGGKSCVAPLAGTTNFAGEGLHLGFKDTFRGNGNHVFDAGCGFAKGCTYDFFGSVPSCIYGNFHLGKPFRWFRNGQDCTLYQTDGNYPVAGLKNITVIFGQEDTMFELDNMGVENIKKLTRKEEEAFWQKYYPGNVLKGSGLTLKSFPGTHIGPYVHHTLYAETLLKGMEEMQ